MFVPIDSRTTSGFRIVEMDRRKTLQANDPIEFTKHFPNSRFGADVVSGREYMRRVEANTETLRFPSIGEDVFDLLERAAEAGALSRGRFQRDLCFHFGYRGQNLIDRGHDCIKPAFFSGAEMCARMHHQERQPELICTDEFLAKRAH